MVGITPACQLDSVVLASVVFAAQYDDGVDLAQRIIVGPREQLVADGAADDRDDEEDAEQ